MLALGFGQSQKQLMESVPRTALGTDSITQLETSNLKPETTSHVENIR